MGGRLSSMAGHNNQEPFPSGPANLPGNQPLMPQRIGFWRQVRMYNTAWEVHKPLNLHIVSCQCLDRGGRSKAARRRRQLTILVLTSTRPSPRRPRSLTHPILTVWEIVRRLCPRSRHMGHKYSATALQRIEAGNGSPSNRGSSGQRVRGERTVTAASRTPQEI